MIEKAILKIIIDKNKKQTMSRKLKKRRIKFVTTNGRLEA